MLNLLSILIGLVALPFIILGWIPFLGWSLWFALVIPVVGTAIGALSDSNAGRNFNLILIVLGGFRLFLGGGLF
jgi:hypothetical protein